MRRGAALDDRDAKQYVAVNAQRRQDARMLRQQPCQLGVARRLGLLRKVDEVQRRLDAVVQR